MRTHFSIAARAQFTRRNLRPILSFIYAFGLFAIVTASGPRIRAEGQQPAPLPVANQEDERESQSTSGPKAETTNPRTVDPNTILRTARTVMVRSRTVFVKDAEVENSLRKHAEFQAWGMLLTKNEADADIIIEIERKPLTRRFTFTVIDPRSMLVLTSGKMRSIILGKTIHSKVAEKFINRLKPIRPFTTRSAGS